GILPGSLDQDVTAEYRINRLARSTQKATGLQTNVRQRQAAVVAMRGRRETYEVGEVGKDMNRSARRGSGAFWLIRSQFRRLLSDIFLSPLVVARSLAGFVALGLLHATDEVHVRREVRETLPDDLLYGIESLVGQEFGQSLLQLIDHLHALKHHAGANLNR